MATSSHIAEADGLGDVLGMAPVKFPFAGIVQAEADAVSAGELGIVFNGAPEAATVTAGRESTELILREKRSSANFFDGPRDSPRDVKPLFDRGQRDSRGGGRRFLFRKLFRGSRIGDLLSAADGVYVAVTSCA